jgi:hypothetical protein
MVVVVICAIGNGATSTYTISGNGWRIHQDGRLDITKDRARIASFNGDFWGSVYYGTGEK